MSGEDGGGQDTEDDDDTLGIPGDAAEDDEKKFIQNLKNQSVHDDVMEVIEVDSVYGTPSGGKRKRATVMIAEICISAPLEDHEDEGCDENVMENINDEEMTVQEDVEDDFVAIPLTGEE
jgi:hypothetical protein